MKAFAMMALLSGLSACLGLPLPSHGAEEKVEDPNEALLVQGKVGTDTRSIIAYLRSKSENDADLLIVDKLVRQLGSRNFKLREDAEAKLLKLEMGALDKLRKATGDSDEEIRKRATALATSIETKTALPVGLAAVRVLLRRQPPELAEVLLRYLPHAGSEEVQDEIAFGLDGLAKNDKNVVAVLAKALTDPLAWRRALAGCILGRIGSNEQRAQVRKLLQDTDPMVRLRAAQGLLAGKDKSAAPTLIALLEGESIFEVWQAEELLFWMAGYDAPGITIGAGGKAQQRKCREAWELWWKNSGPKVDLTRPEFDLRRPGLLLVCGEDVEIGPSEPGRGRLWLCGCDGQPRWEIRKLANGSFGIFLPGERVVIGEWVPAAGEEDPAHPLTIRNLQGNVLWKHTDTDLTGVQRLPNGEFAVNASGIYRVGVAGRSEIRNFWLDKERRKPVWMYGTGAQMLENGDVLLHDQDDGTIRLFDPSSGLPRHLVQLAGHKKGICQSLYRLRGEKYWVWDAKGKQAREYDLGGKEIARIPLPEDLDRAIPLRNGNVLLAGKSIQHTVRMSLLLEIDRSGRRVWEVIVGHRPEFNFSEPEFAFREVLACFDLVRLGFDEPRAPGHDVEQVPFVAQALKSKNVLVRRRAVLRVIGFGAKAEPALPDLFAALKDSDHGVRGGAACALGSLGKAAEPAIPDMVKLLGDEKWPKLPDGVAGSLHRLGAKSIEPVIAATKHPDANVRIGAGICLFLFVADESRSLLGATRRQGRGGAVGIARSSRVPSRKNEGANTTCSVEGSQGSGPPKKSERGRSRAVHVRSRGERSPAPAEEDCVRERSISPEHPQCRSVRN